MVVYRSVLGSPSGWKLDQRIEVKDRFIHFAATQIRAIVLVNE